MEAAAGFVTSSGRCSDVYTSVLLVAEDPAPHAALSLLSPELWLSELQDDMARKPQLSPSHCYLLRCSHRTW